MLLCSMGNDMDANRYADLNETGKECQYIYIYLLRFSEKISLEFAIPLDLDCA